MNIFYRLHLNWIEISFDWNIFKKTYLNLWIFDLFYLNITETVTLDSETLDFETLDSELVDSEIIIHLKHFSRRPKLLRAANNLNNLNV